MAGGGKFFVSVTADRDYKKVISALESKLPFGVELATRNTVERVRGLVYEVLRYIFQNAYLRSPEAFPPAYLIQLLSSLALLNVDVKVDKYSFNVSVNLGDLGTHEELIQGYHYGAQLTSGGQVELPYGSASLKNDVYQRYLFWEALRFKTLYKGRALSDDLWSSTISARVGFWTSIEKSPQWLLLQYGQEEWEPKNEAFPVVEELREIIYSTAQGIYAQELMSAYRATAIREYGSFNYPVSLVQKGGAGKVIESEITSDISAKLGKFPVHYNSYIIAAINARTNEGLVNALKQLESIRGVDIALLRRIVNPGRSYIPPPTP
jgi:hypothetical protein